MIDLAEIKNPFVNAKVLATGALPSEYHKEVGTRGQPDYVMSRSQLMEFATCPHRWLMGVENDETKSTEWGTLLDCLLLGDDGEFERRFAVAPEMYTGPKGEQKPWTYQATVCKEWKAEVEKNGKIPIKVDVYDNARLALDVLLADPVVKSLVDGGESQVFATADYADEETGIVVPVKVLIDLVPYGGDQDFGKSLFDLKTATSAAPGPWQRAVFDHGYHVQAAMYLDVYAAATGEDRNTFCHIIQENYAPWEIGKRMLSAEYVNLGRAKYTDALKRYCQCLKTGEWPGYDGTASTRLGLMPGGFNLCEPLPWMIGEA